MIPVNSSDFGEVTNETVTTCELNVLGRISGMQETH